MLKLNYLSLSTINLNIKKLTSEEREKKQVIVLMFFFINVKFFISSID